MIAFTFHSRAVCGHVVEVALGIGIVEIDRGRHDLVLQRFDANGHFDRAGRAEHVAGGALGGTDRKFLRVLAEDGLDGLRFSKRRPAAWKCRAR